MTNVWVGHDSMEAAFVPGNGWTQVLPAFSSTTDLKSILETRQDLVGQISHLGICAHGEQNFPGSVMLNVRLSPTGHQARQLWSTLDRYLTRRGKLTFYSCTAGAGTRGTRLIETISSFLPGRLISGFITFGIKYSNSNLRAGLLFDTLRTAQPSEQIPRAPRFDHRRPSLKQARNGVIVRWPRLRPLWEDVIRYDPALSHRCSEIAVQSHNQRQNHYRFLSEDADASLEERAASVREQRARAALLNWRRGESAGYGYNDPNGRLYGHTRGDGRQWEPLNPVYDSPFDVYVRRFVDAGI